MFTIKCLGSGPGYGYHYDVSVVFTRYMLLAVEQRENTDLRSIGELFYLGVDELPDLQFTEALHLVIIAVEGATLI